MKLYDLSIPTGVQTPPWPTYEPLQVQYFKRLSSNGANGQIIRSSNHVGTHLDGQCHFVTGGMDIASIPLDRLYGPGVVVDLSDIAEDYGIYTSADIERRVDVHEGDILFIHTGYSRYGWDQPEADEQRYMLRHPGPTREFWQWCLRKRIKLLGIDAGSQDHPMNTKIRDWRPDEAAKADAHLKERYGKGLGDFFAPEDYQGMHFCLFPDGILHVECLGGEIKQVLNRRTTLGVFPWKFKDGEAAFCRVVAFCAD
ncbi:MAG: cyclase family protein [Mycobacterium leprae]